MSVRRKCRGKLSYAKYLILGSWCLILFPATSYAQTYDQLVSAYIDQYKGIAIEEMQRVGIPASITLAQGIIESRAGQSPLATEANNHFGIKCHDDWNGETFLFDDDEKQECFRKYNSALESYQDHSDFLKSHARYATLFQMNINDYKKWAKGLKACGYATNPQYAQMLIKTIEDYDLHQWDLNDEDRIKWLAQNQQDSLQQNTPATKRIDPVVAPITAENADERVYVFNNIKCITMEKGESLNDIAIAFQIGLSRLMRYNDMTTTSQVGLGDRIYLQPKRHSGDVKYYIAQANDNMFTISRDHGISLQKLYEKNKMQPGTEPATGEKIYLRSVRSSPPKLQSKQKEQKIISDNTIPQATSTDSLPVPRFYVVSKGDTLFSISKKYNRSVEELREMNKLPGNTIYVGERLKISE